MTTGLRKHLQSGEVRLAEDDVFYCNICEVPLGVHPLQHLNGSQHRNKIFFYGIQYPKKYPILYNDLPDSVRAAVQDKIITGHDLKIKCHSCAIFLSGEKPLTDHLKSSGHRKKTDMKKVSQVAQGVENIKIVPVGEKPAGKPNVKIPERILKVPKKPVEDLQNDSVGEKAIQSELEAGYIEDLGGVYKCTLCLMSLTGREPLLQHINGRRHLSKIGASAQDGDPKNEPQPLPKREETEDDLFGSSKHRSKSQGQKSTTGRKGKETPSQGNEAMFYALHNPQYSNPSFLQTPEQQPNVAAGFSSPPASLPHHDTKRRERSPGHRLRPPSKPGASPFSGSSTFKVKRTGWPGFRSSTAYRLLTRPRGFVGVFNNHFDDHPEWKRDGSLLDDFNLQSVFEQMEYRVELFPNKTKSQVFSLLENILRNIIGVDSLILFFLSHGKDERRFYSADRQLVDIRDIWIRLSDQNCPALRDKPKILFLNYCRGETRQSNRFFDNISESEEEAPKDVALVHASLPGFKAQRLPHEGTVFIHSLCQVICESVYEKDIHEIIYETTELMQQKGGTTPSIEFIHFRKFYFID